MPKTIKLHHHTQQQAHEIHTLMQAAYRVEAELIGTKNFPPLKRTIAQIRNAQSTFWGLMDDQVMVGLIEYSEPRKGFIHIDALVVDPRHHRNGHASQMLTQLTEQKSFAQIEVATAQVNEPAICLYKKHGFTEKNMTQTDCGIVIVTLVLI